MNDKNWQLREGDPFVELNAPCISIDRGAKKFAVFDGYNCVRTFEAYTSEAQALADGKAWVAERTDVEPEITYPRITKMTITTSRSKK